MLAKARSKPNEPSRNRSFRLNSVAPAKFTVVRILDPYAGAEIRFVRFDGYVRKRSWASNLWMTILLCVFYRNRQTSLMCLFDNFRFEIILYRLPIYLTLYTELFTFQAKLHPSISFLPISIFIFKKYLLICSEFLKLYLVYSHV